MPSEIKSFFLNGPAGKLEALLNVGSPIATYAAVVTHPHPLFGGTMHNKIVFNAMKALSSFGFPVLRFNFRGTGLSDGAHDEGRGEIDDVRTALSWMDQTFGVPLIFAGFSFGAATGLRAACPDTRVAGVISLGTPVAVQGRSYAYSFLADCKKPKLFISGSRDQYGAMENLREVVAQAAEPKQFYVIEDADHFFEGKVPLMRSAIEEWVRSTFVDSATLRQ
ncbi:MAG TPA: alpha/beta fold hydrolase [Terriglobales bacterium]